MLNPFRLVGVDFTSAPRRAKPITVARARLASTGEGPAGPTLHVDAVDSLDTFAAFEALLHEPGPWIGGFDFPFGLPRTAVADLGWPTDWRGLALACAQMPRAAFRACLDAHRQARVVGDRYVHRAVDRPAASHSPLKLVNPPVALMFLEGAARLARAGITVAGHVEGDPRRIAVEAYPGYLVRGITRLPYKSDTRAKQTPQRLAARVTILDALCRGDHPLGIRVSAAQSLLDRALADASGDTLDAIVCAVQAGWALQQPRFGVPACVDPIEGWIAGVPAPVPASVPASVPAPVSAPVDATTPSLRLPVELARWFERRGWRPFPFQRELWQAHAHGHSGLLHATTGSGKTYAVWFAALIEALRGGSRRPQPRPFTVLWVTPMRALAADTARALAEPLAELGLEWTIGTRTGDTASAERARQQRRPPTALVTTPESLSVMLAQADAASLLGNVKLVVVDEWHELLGSKRGVQAQLALARLRRFSPGLRIWGLSATIGNLGQARDALLGSASAEGVLVQGKVPKRVVVDTVIPDAPERFPWAGHLGMRMVEPVAREIESAATTLVFTNVRSHAEQWYQALLEARPQWAGMIALHHGSLDRRLRDWVEMGLKEGRLKAVVCTSSLDLGVDFLPVERVIQIGSPKGIARLLQRAGRSGHAPGRVSRISCVPTHSFELIEAAAARIAAGERRVESRTPPEAPVDVLVQHLVTVALGGGFDADALFAEVRATWAYRDLARATFDWALDFVTRGGALHAYPEYRRVVRSEDGLYRVPDRAIARRHRMSIGTITADSAMDVRFISGGRVGTVEESFVSRLKPGQAFLLGGRLLSLVRIREMTAYVQRAKAGTAAVPRWMGGRSPLSTELAQAVVELIGRAAQGDRSLPELRAVSRLVELQQRWSVMPRADELLVETVHTREGHHLFCFPFGGRLVHTGLASLFGWRVSRAAPNTFSVAVSDYGFELLSPVPVDWQAAFDGGLLDERDLQHDLLESLNAGELARRQFREIARVSGLVFTGFPGQPKRARELQASAGLLHDVFEKHDPENLLLAQARAEVMRDELDLARLTDTLARMRAMTLRRVAVGHPTPFAFPLMAARIREKVSTEKVGDRIARMVAELERAAGAG